MDGKIGSVISTLGTALFLVSIFTLSALYSYAQEQPKEEPVEQNSGYDQGGEGWGGSGGYNGSLSGNEELPGGRSGRGDNRKTGQKKKSGPPTGNTKSDVQKLREANSEGIELINKGEFYDALKLFEDIYASPSLPPKGRKSVLYNMGQASRAIAERRGLKTFAVNAVKYYELYLKIPPKPNAKGRADVMGRIKQLKKDFKL